MAMIKLNIINDLKTLLKNKYSEFEGVYFFGSRAKGNATAKSDYDLALIFSREIDRSFRDEVIELVYELDLKYDVILDVKVFSANDILYPITPFRYNIKNEGIYYGV